MADPKAILNSALDAASELSGRKLANFQRDRRAVWVADRIEDFTPLRKLEAFTAFEAEVGEFARKWVSTASDPA